MIIEQYYLECLSHASYLVGDETTGRAVVIDPQRDVSGYLADAERLGLRIELVLETHFHADFLSGHLELAEATGAEIALGEVAAETAEIPIRALAHGERISLGDVTLEIRHTPGHTPESISIVVYEHADDAAPHGVFTGDTLFIGDVGRPDLLASIGFTAEQLADMLYDSLHDQLMTLPPSTTVYPAHGAGSACGKQLSAELTSTIGEQLESNYALADLSREEFTAVVTEGQPAAPEYFVYDAILNRQERATFDESAQLPAMTLAELDAAVADGAVVLDARSPEVFALGHLRGSINVGLGGRFAEYAGSVVPSDVDVVVVAEPGTEAEARTRMARIGFDRVVGHLAQPEQVFVEHPDRVVQATRWSVHELERQRDDVQLVDIRNAGELADGSIEGAIHVPLGMLRRRLADLDRDRRTVVYCAGGYRSSIAASLLRSEGFGDVSDLIGGFGAWVEHQSAQPA